VVRIRFIIGNILILFCVCVWGGGIVRIYGRANKYNLALANLPGVCRGASTNRDAACSALFR